MAETQAKVVFDYNPDGPNQLELRKGQTITVLGSPNSDGWVEAKKGAQVGWIPAGYYEVTKTTAATGAGESGGAVAPPPAAKTTTTSSASGVTYTSSKVANASDSFAMFAYQTEWWTYTIATMGTLLTFFNGTTDDSDDPRNWILGTFALILVCVQIACHSRDSVVVCCMPCMENALLSRLILWVVILLCIAVSWPIGTFVAGPVLVCICVQAYMMFAGLDEAPEAMTESFRNECEWVCCNPACSIGKIGTAFLFFILNILAGIWGYIEGEERAEDLQDDVEAYDIRTSAYGAQTMFGRMFTVNLVIVTMISLRTCCVRDADGIMGTLCLPWANEDVRKTLHRIGGYFMVFSLLWHMLFAYYSWELSGSTHDYFEVFGYETAITGGFLLLMMGLIIGSANNSFYKFDKGSFKWTHAFMAWLLLLCLMFHGEMGLNTLYWYIGLVPTVMYTGDIFLRMVRDTNASPQDEF